MSDPNDRDSSAASGHETSAGDSAAERIGRADTLDDTAEQSSAPPASGTFPPTAWDRDDGLVTSAAPPGAAEGTPVYAGTMAGERLSEARAREILDARFTTAGLALEADYPFSADSFIVTLDGYDSERKIGYAYVSHADADVVTDFDEASEMTVEQLASRGVAWILLIHDSDIPSEDALERRIDAFFAGLPRFSPGPNKV